MIVVFCLSNGIINSSKNKRKCQKKNKKRMRYKKSSNDRIYFIRGERLCRLLRGHTKSDIMLDWYIVSGDVYWTSFSCKKGGSILSKKLFSIVRAVQANLTKSDDEFDVLDLLSNVVLIPH